jgi:hypothetical protein
MGFASVVKNDSTKLLESESMFHGRVKAVKKMRLLKDENMTRKKGVQWITGKCGEIRPGVYLTWFPTRNRTMLDQTSRLLM